MKIIKLQYPNPIPKEYSGIVEWYWDINNNGTFFCVDHFVTGKLHRLDGPAIECMPDTRRFYINGNYITNKEQDFCSSKEYKQWTLLENMKKIKNINE